MILPEHQMLYVRSMGKALRVTAVFHDEAAANDFMTQRREQAVVAVFGGLILMADQYDNGIVIPRDSVTERVTPVSVGGRFL